MKKNLKSAMYVLIALCISITFSYGQSKTETLFKIINNGVPDSVVFTLTPGNEIKAISVYLVSGEQSFGGATYASGTMRMSSGNMYFTEKTILTSKEFNIPDGFKAKQIKFDTGDTILYYDIAAKKWTSK
jgi:hypothetical protein